MFANPPRHSIERHRRNRRDRRDRRAAFTLVELLMALVITAMTGAAVATLYSAANAGTVGGNEMRSLLVRTRAVDARLNGMFRSAKGILYPNSANPTSTDYIIVWAADSNEDGAAQNNEVHLIERRAANQSLYDYNNPTDTAAFDTPAAFRAAAVASYPSKRWAQGVTAMSFTANIQATNDTLVSYRFTMKENETSETCVGAAAVRN